MGDFMSDYANKHIRCFNPASDGKSLNEKGRIYHYTSPNGIFGILGSRSIRFTDCQFLNDKSEYTHIKKPLEKALEEIKNDLHIDFQTSILKMLKEEFESDDINVIKKETGLAFSLTKKRYYIFCSSTAQDSLGMWNYYVKGGNYQGYNIGFNVRQLLDCFSTIENADVDVFYGRIMYKGKEQIEFLKAILLKADEELEEKLRKATSGEEVDNANHEAIDSVMNYIENYRLFFKDESFSNEKEYRFIIKLPLEYTPNDNSPLLTGFDVRNGIIVPYCQLTISKESSIESIMLSPMLESELAKQGLKRFLWSRGYNSKINIVQSKVPIRY